MIHYSCDRCKRELDPVEDLRYVLKIEVEAAMEPISEGDLDDDRDHLMEIEDILERADDDLNEAIGEDIYQRRRFDLCPDCYRKFAKNPLGQDLKLTLGFSQN